MQFVFDARTCTSHFPGIGRYVRSLLCAMVPRLEGDRLTVLVGEGSLLPESLLEVDGVEAHSVAGSAFSVSVPRSIPRVLLEVGADVYHSPYLLAPLDAGVPSVVTLHDLIPLTHARWSSLRSRLIYRFWGLRVLRRADRVIAVSRYTAEQAIRRGRVASDRISVISHGVDACFVPAEPMGGEPYLLYVGSDRPHKGLDTLLQAMAREPGLPELRIVGKQSQNAARRAQVAKLGIGARVQWLGEVTEEALPGVYAAATALVMPSRVEGFGLPVLEAMACGCAVVTSDIEPLRELGGDATESFAVGDANALGAVLARVCGDASLRSGMCSRGLARAAEHRWELAAEQTLTVYRALVSGNVV